MTIDKLTFDPVALVLGIIAIIECVRGEYGASLVFLVGAQAGWLPMSWEASHNVQRRARYLVPLFIVFMLLGYLVLAIDAAHVIA